MDLGIRLIVMDPGISAWFLQQGYLILIAGTLTAGSVLAAMMYHLFVLLRSKYGIEMLSPRSSCSRWPPSPPALPILGHMHLITANVHLDMHALSIKYGPLYHVRMGSTDAIVVSSASVAKLFLKTHDKCFASRVSVGAAVEIFSHNFQDLACAPYGSHWRHMRRICMLELFNSKRIGSFANLRNEEVCSLVKSISDESVSGELVIMSEKLAHLMLNVISLMTMGKRLIPWGSRHGKKDAELQEFLDTVKATFSLSGVINNLGDYFPSLRWLDLQGYERRMRKATKSFDDFVLKMIEHKRAVKSFDSNVQKDLLDVLLSLPNEKNGKLSDDIVMAIMLDILSAGVDTSSTTVEWAFAELVRNPTVMAKVQAEIDSYVGKARKVGENDLPHLTYLEAVVKETFRLHPAAPLLIPHESIEPCKVMGYNIPAKTRLYVNVWAIGRDPSEWDRPQDFYPERFLENNIDVRGQDFQVLPFGSGRRMCPGMSLGLIVVQFTLARLLHSFNFSLPSGQRPEDLDMSETFGLTMAKTEPLGLIATPRLPRELY